MLTGASGPHAITVKDALIDGLKRMEYRGYDSAGVAVLSGKDLLVEKHQGKVKILADACALRDDMNTAHAGIAHTRWATHGVPSDIRFIHM